MSSLPMRGDVKWNKNDEERKLAQFMLLLQVCRASRWSGLGLMRCLSGSMTLGISSPIMVPCQSIPRSSSLGTSS